MLNAYIRSFSRSFCSGNDSDSDDILPPAPASAPAPAPAPAPKGASSNNTREIAAFMFEVNGQPVEVNTSFVSSTTSLARFLRSDLSLTGTKISCNQAGCGACVVTAQIPESSRAGNYVTRSINSCITPVYKCAGWKITTVEGLGNTRDGLHPVQDRLAAFHGTQCGFCTPGMVMLMNSFLKNTPDPTVKEIEALLDGNICRCTGYRPILDAFKSFAVDAPDHIKQELSDIEDLVPSTNEKGDLFTCPKTRQPCQGTCAGYGGFGVQPTRLIRSLDGDWLSPTNLDELLNLLNSPVPGPTYKLVAGNTGTGIFPDGHHSSYIDISGIPELRTHSATPFKIGSGVSLTEFIKLLVRQAYLDPVAFAYAKQMASHIEHVAHVNVRNIGSIGGNLMLKHFHRDFPSDLFVLLEAIGARIDVQMADTKLVTTVSPAQFLAIRMDRAVLVAITLPALTENHLFVSYKITPRRQNAHAYVNAAFLAELARPNQATVAVVSKPNLVYGGIGPDFIHASKTERFLVGKNLLNSSTLAGPLKIIEEEVVPNRDPVLADPEYRKHLAKALYYKFLLTALGPLATPRLRSGASQLSRGVSQGHQSFPTNPANYPISQPIQKLEAKIQCTGEAEFTDDIAPGPSELCAALVLSTVGNAELDVVDPKPALALAGVVDFVNYMDIPGTNIAYLDDKEQEVFCSGRVHYAGQALGLIVADTYEHARQAARAVRVTYKNRQKPVLVVMPQEPLQNNFRQNDVPVALSSLPATADAAANQNNDEKTISGEFRIGAQYHFHMETHSCLVTPQEDHQFDIRLATQFSAEALRCTAKCLNVSENKITITVRRLGGAYGGKIMPPNQIATAAAVAADKLRRPVRLVLDLQTNMEMIGKRSPYFVKYSASIDAQNKLSKVCAEMYSDNGYANNNEVDAQRAKAFFQNCYRSEAWQLDGTGVVTNTPTTQACRAPASTQGHAIMETMLEHIAWSQGLDPIELRMANLLQEGDHLVSENESFHGPNPLPAMVQQLKQSSDYEQRNRAVQQFNKDNAWKKRAVSFVPLRWHHLYSDIVSFTVQLSVYQDDGSVALSHGGIELGQGVNTKVAQVVARQLGIHIGTISIKPTNTMVSNNNSMTGGSMASDLCCEAARLACAKLKEKMSPSRKEDWLQTVKACAQQGIDLSARHTSYPSTDGTRSYTIWGAAFTEVEVDILTGEKTVRRVDLIEDTGSSISPKIDVGQVEGAFVMSLGLWLTEELKYEPESGRLLTRDTWEYKPPCSQDIPEDFRATLYNSGNKPGGVFGSKATGESPFLMGVSAFFAVRKAVHEARVERGMELAEKWVRMDAPATNENIHKTSGITSEYFFL